MQYFTPKFWQMTVGFLVIVSMALAVTLYVGKKQQVSTTISALTR